MSRSLWRKGREREAAGGDQVFSLPVNCSLKRCLQPQATSPASRWKQALLSWASSSVPCKSRSYFADHSPIWRPCTSKCERVFHSWFNLPPVVIQLVSKHPADTHKGAETATRPVHLCVHLNLGSSEGRGGPSCQNGSPPQMRASRAPKCTTVTKCSVTHTHPNHRTTIPSIL